jgi:porphobilinogen deaminase
MSYLDPEPDENITVTFILKGDTYKKLCTRLAKYGDRSLFFRTVTEKFLSGEISIAVPERKL